jgi:hypothetical protein
VNGASYLHGLSTSVRAGVSSRPDSPAGWQGKCGRAARVVLPLGAKPNPPHFVFQGGLANARHQGRRRLFPDANQGRPCIAGWHPGAGQPVGITDRGKDVVHGSSLCGSCRHTLIAQPGGGWQGRHESSVREGVSLGFCNRRLTRSNHRSYAGMSGKEVVDSRAKGGFLAAHSSTRKNLRYSEVLVQNRCS